MLRFVESVAPKAWFIQSAAVIVIIGLAALITLLQGVASLFGHLPTDPDFWSECLDVWVSLMRWVVQVAFAVLAGYGYCLLRQNKA